jgi:hypothetical protein
MAGAQPLLFREDGPLYRFYDVQLNCSFASKYNYIERYRGPNIATSF